MHFVVQNSDFVAYAGCDDDSCDPNPGSLRKYAIHAHVTMCIAVPEAHHQPHGLV